MLPLGNVFGHSENYLCSLVDSMLNLLNVWLASDNRNLQNNIGLQNCYGLTVCDVLGLTGGATPR